MAFILIYGPGGSGKTTLAASMTKLGYKVNIMDVDNKSNEMENLSVQIAAGNINVIPVTSKLVSLNLEDRLRAMANASKGVPVKQEEPEGYLAYCKHITNFERLLADGQERKNEVLVCDSFTRLQEHMRRLIMYLNRREKFTFDEWDTWKTNIEEFIVAHQRLQGLFKHVIIISHEQFERDELIGKISVLPMVDGSMKHKMIGYFTEVYHTFVNVKGDKAEYKVATRSIDRADARTSRKLDTIEEADFYNLFKEERK